MEKKNFEEEYLNVLRLIVLENTKKDYTNIKSAYKSGEISLKEAYERILHKSGNDLEKALNKPTSDRTGTKTYKICGSRMEFDLSDGKIPLLTTKRVFTKGIVEELLWFIKGDTNIKYLVDRDVNFWNSDAFRMYVKKNNLQKEYPINSAAFKEKVEWFKEKIKTDDEFAKKWGELGPVYGKQWRNFGGKNKKGSDQIANLIETLKKDHSDRRMIVSAWNPLDKEKQALAPCHLYFQIVVTNENTINLFQINRSNDVFLGLPFNLASYAILLRMIAQVTGFKPGKLVMSTADAHIYSDHIEQVQEQLARIPGKAPKLKLNSNIKNIDDFTAKDIKIEKYNPQGVIKAPISV